MSEDIAIKINEVSKTFRLPHEKQASIKGSLINFRKGKKGFEKQKALNDVSFEVKKGEFFGIVGRNGSGKSTLLKMLAGIYSPSKGSVQVNGKLTPFIELGVGFNPELTGRENVFLNGALLGFNRKEMNLMYEDIVEFAELERFMDQKLKNYSSGMQVRLAFSIAIKAETDILLLDEVLAVGDEAFQKKCLSIFDKYKSEKQTIVLVTHDMAIVNRYCDKAILINAGEIIKEGDPREVAHQYSVMNTDRYIKYKAQKLSKKPQLVSHDNEVQVKIKNSEYQTTSSFGYGDTVIVQIKWTDERVKNIGVALLTQLGEYVYGTNTIIDKHDIKNRQVTYSLKMNVGNGDFEFRLGLFGDSETEAIKYIDEGLEIYVAPVPKKNWDGITKLEHKWL